MLGALFDRPRDAIGANPWGEWSGEGDASHAGPRVTPSSATQLLTVYGCDRFIGDGISTLPLDTFAAKAGGPAHEIDPPAWVLNPTPDLDSIAWRGQAITSWLLGGDLFARVTRARGKTQAVEPLNPQAVEVIRKSGRKWYRVNGREVDPFSMLHVPAIMFPGADRGMSPVEAAMQAIGIGLAAQEFGGRFFSQGMSLGGVIEVPGEMDPGQTREMARAWQRKHGGKHNAGLPGVLKGGAQWKPIQLSNEQSQFLETRGYTAAEIAGQMFLIDPSEMGLPVEGKSLTYTNQEERNNRKVQVTFLPWLVRLERALSSLLPRGQYVKLNVDGLLRGDMKTRYQSYATGITGQFMVPNEARALEDLPPLPDGDQVVTNATAPTVPPG